MNRLRSGPRYECSCVAAYKEINNGFYSQYTSGRFNTNYRATIGADFITKAVPHHSNPEDSVQLQIWVSFFSFHSRHLQVAMCSFLLTVLRVFAAWLITDALRNQDTAGQERFSSLATAFFRGADAVILVYDVTDPTSLPSLAKWWDEFRTRAPVEEGREIEFPVAIVGT